MAANAESSSPPAVYAEMIKQKDMENLEADPRLTCFLTETAEGCVPCVCKRGNSGTYRLPIPNIPTRPMADWRSRQKPRACSAAS